MDVGDVDVHFDDLQAGGSFDLVDDVAANVVADVEDGVAILDDDGDINGGLGFALVDGDAAGDVGLGGGDAVGDGAEARRTALPMPYTPGTWRAAMPAILATTFSSMVVVPWSVWRGLGSLVLVNVLVVVAHVSLFH